MAQTTILFYGMCAHRCVCAVAGTQVAHSARSCMHAVTAPSLPAGFVRCDCLSWSLVVAGSHRQQAREDVRRCRHHVEQEHRRRRQERRVARRRAHRHGQLHADAVQGSAALSAVHSTLLTCAMSLSPLPPIRLFVLRRQPALTTRGFVEADFVKVRLWRRSSRQLASLRPLHRT